MGGPRRRWSESVPRGRMVTHPAVLAFVERGDAGTRPRLHHVQGLPIVAYSSTRVFMKRDAWEMLPDNGVLVQWVRPKGQAPFAIALAPDELQDVFGEVAKAACWDDPDVRSYHFPKEPVAARSFKVLSARPSSAPTPRPPSPTAAPPALRPAPAPVRRVSIEEAATRVAELLIRHPSLAEESLVEAAGSARTYRRLRKRMALLPLPDEHRVVVEPTPSGVVWRLVSSSP